MSEKDKLKLNEDYHIIQANEFIRNSYKDNLSLLEAKLLRLCIANIGKEDTKLLRYTCNAMELGRFLGIDNKHIYRDLKALNMELVGKKIYLESINKNKKNKDKPNYIVFNWVSMAKYEDGEITIQLNEEIRPYLIGLKELFTDYSFAEILQLKSNYGIMLFELLCSWRNNMILKTRNTYTIDDTELKDNEFYFDIDYLRQYFNCKDKYKNNNGDFVKRVIDSAVIDIKKNIYNALFDLDYRKVIKGKSMKGIIFTIYNKKIGNTDFENQIALW